MVTTTLDVVIPEEKFKFSGNRTEKPFADVTTPVDPSFAPQSTAPAPSPTVGESLLGQVQGLQGQVDKIRTMEEALAAGRGGPVIGSFEEEQTVDPFDDERARKQAQRDQLRLHQAEIDATNQIYDEQLRVARLEGEGRIGSTRAIGARGGILGSDFAGAQKAGQQSANTAEQRAIGAERSAKIGSIMGRVRSSVLAQMEEKRAAYTLGADALLANISGQSKAKEANVNQFAGDLIAQGFDIADLDEEELKAFASEAGVTTQDLIAGYARAQASQQKEEGDPFTLKEGEQRFDAEGNLVASGKDKKVVLKEGDVVLDAEGNVVRKVAKTKAPGVGGTGKNLTSGSLNLSAEDVGDGAQQLESSRGSDGYVDSQLYADMLSFFADQGGLVQDFVKTYPADLYLNPDDPTVKEFVKTELQRDTTDELTQLLFGDV